ncbi:MAG: site-specific integrase [Thermoplasmataceae archaeon]
MHPQTRHKRLLKNKKVERWYENLKAKSQVTSDVYLRNFGLWLEYLDKDPDSIIEFAKNEFEEFKGSISDKIRELEKGGMAGSSISTSIKPMISYLKFNNVVVRLGINIKNENRNLNAEKEIVPDGDQLSSVLRRATVRERVSISLMAFSGLRPEVLGNIDGTDGLRLGDIPDLEISGKEIKVKKTPARIIVRPELSKIRKQYFTFIGDEGIRYLLEYLNDRMQRENLDYDSPLILPDPDMQRSEKANQFLMTTLLLRRIKAFIVKSGFNWRPYIFRVYFGTNLDTAESKGLISHPWRQFIMGHKGDIEETYTKREGMVDEGREQYSKCLKFLETEQKGISEDQAEKKAKSVMMKLAGFSDAEIENMKDGSAEELGEAIRRKLLGSLNNDNSQKVVSVKDVKDYINKGWEYVNTLPGNKEATLRLPHS